MMLEHLANEILMKIFEYLIERFFSYHNLSLEKFSHLKSLSISYLHSESLMFKIINELSHLPLLTHLKFIECRFRFNQQDTQYILNRIFVKTARIQTFAFLPVVLITI